VDERTHIVPRNAAWAAAGPLELKLTALQGACAHAEGTVYAFANPYELPSGLCEAMATVVRGYLWRVALGFPSWEADDPGVYRLHCPSKTGAVWELRRVEAG
jgi:hypothetical protein